MEFKCINESTIEILPGDLSPERLLAEMARLSYETARSPLPQFIQPVEVEPSHVDFKSLVTSKGLHMDYLNGMLCSTHVERRGDRLIFDAKSFRQDRGAPTVFLNLLKQRLKSLGE